MMPDRSDWRTYRVISLNDLFAQGARVAAGTRRVARVPCLPNVEVAIPPITFGQVRPPSFPIEQNPADSWVAPSYSITDGHAFVIQDAVVQGELGIVTVDDFVVQETLHFALPAHVGRFEWTGDRQLRLPPPASEASVAAAAHLLCGYVGNRNYAHWLVDVVPSLLVPPFHDTYSGATLLWPKLRNRWQNELLDLLPEATADAMFLEEEQHVRCESVVIVPRLKISDFQPHPHRMILFDTIRERAGVSAWPRRRIYISRSDSGARRMLNEEDLVRILQRHGFEIVTLTGLPVTEQIALFSDASHIVAPHGAGLANAIFSPAGAVLCELHMDSYVQWAFRRLSALPPLTYGCLVGSTMDHGQWVHRNTWHAPLEHLARVLQAPPFTTGIIAMPYVVTQESESAGSPADVSPPPPTRRVRNLVVDRIWRGNDPFIGFPGELYAPDTQGWNSVHPYLLSTLDDIRPSIVVEIGVWKGGSVLTMASRLKELGLDAVVIAIDTWLGSWEHWHKNELFKLLDVMNGHPAIFQKFMGNVVRAGLQDYVVPLPLNSINAGHLLKLLDIQPDIVHIDGCHDYEAVIGDFSLWWPQIKYGGALIGDDYYDNGVWPEVRKAVDEFVGSRSLRKFEHLGGKCRLLKPIPPM